MPYDHHAIEARWQRYWDEHATFRAVRHAGRPKKYVLDMFPYPSGAGLHVGHPEGYTATDIVSRHLRMRGVDVLHPMGWDAFGLPAEQHAIETGTHPAVTTRENIGVFRRQLKRLGFAYDWSREIDTTDPAYVRWTQWIFLRLFERGLAFQAEIPVNWCPALGTVLANEEVVDGKSERGGHPVVREPLRQWQLRITAYADRLASDLGSLDWPEATKAKQIEWIGRSEGAEVDFPLVGHPGALTVFTTRPDTLFGATYMVIAPDHPRTLEITAPELRSTVKEYVAAAARKSDMERTAVAKDKTGVFIGAFCTNPLTTKPIPVYTADYVLGAYGTGAIMAVPAHDERDFAFATQMNLPIVEVVSPDGRLHDRLEAAFTGDGTAVRSGEFDGLATPEMKRRIIDHLEAKGIGRRKVNYKLRDWVFSRQRYWGEPIPVYFPVDTAGDPRRGAPATIDYTRPIPLADAELPLLLPALEDYKPGDPQGPLAKALDWRFFQKDGRWFARETNTMPQWAGSCWYYLRFVDPHDEREIVSAKAYDDWMPIDLYVGGAEHTVLHLLYARFWHKVLYDVGVVKDPEPFLKLVHQGMILGETGEKMSKSRGNVINPDDVVHQAGADALRVYEMFMGPLEQVKPWQTAGLQGVRRFLDRVHVVATRTASNAIDDETKRLVHRTVKKVTDDIAAMRFNTAVSAMMILTNHLQALDHPPREALEKLVLCLSPYAPHLAEELWERLGHTPSIADHPWPTYDPALCVDDQIEIAVQVNGRVRGRITVARDTPEAVARDLALGDEGAKPFLEGKTVKKIVYVPGRIVNLIVG
ncbi:MAG TPA: leucine--tRNA ligase [Candidatus Eisenbacteria bacterium]|nr:leucine--tRNA ligase [Candidatus Eisenbacteria bacterium]